MATANDLPNELLLDIFPHFVLSALLAARAVNKKWRQLVAVALPDIPSPRRRLVELYIDAISSPAFLETREDIIPHISDFDREQYVASLESAAAHALPDEFRTWLLEWPARAVIGWFWPGLSTVSVDAGSPAWASGEYYLKQPPIHRDALLPYLSGEGESASRRLVNYSRIIGTADSVWVVDLHWGTVELLGFPCMTCIFFAGDGVGEKLAGQVRSVGSRIDVHDAAPDWIDFLRGELDYEARSLWLE